MAHVKVPMSLSPPPPQPPQPQPQPQSASVSSSSPAPSRSAHPTPPAPPSGKPIPFSGPHKRAREEEDEPSFRAVPQSRKRASIACEICRLRKTRCDTGKPSCSFCTQLGVECVYRKPVIERKIEQESAENPLGKIGNRLDRIEQLLLDASFRSQPFPGQQVAPPPPPPPQFAHGNGVISHSRPVSQAQHIIPESIYQAPRIGPQTVTFNATAPFKGLGRLPNQNSPPELSPLEQDDSEGFLERELQQGEILTHAGNPDDLDLSQRTCLRLEQSFARFVLPWFPLFDPDTCVEQITQTINQGFGLPTLYTSFTLFVLALGALAKADHHTSDAAHELPGLNYYLAACRGMKQNSGQYTIVAVQGMILKSLYLLLALRTFHARETVNTALQTLIPILHLKARLQADVRLREACHRAFWACYIIIRELDFSIFSAIDSPFLLEDALPLPYSDRDEPGLAKFLNLIEFNRKTTRAALTRLTQDNSGVEDLLEEYKEWYRNLTPSVAFPLGTSLILDPQKAYMRTRYDSVGVMISWTAVLRYATPGLESESERERTLRDAQQALDFAVLYIYASESLVLERHVMLFANLTGLFVVSMCLLTTFAIPALKAPDHRGAIPAIHKAHSLLSVWAANPSVAANLRRMEDFMAKARLSPE
ncbi:hypothetical protein M501DRAFT_1031460 [Patellaria atrata CBS 101060]|uniref:Zn(2)-C6 fungal-type domain-containing protein n=1 Tax=Patellaria atrata CBS 101060 TaxID=1346257 RepID=A0A9P4VQ14_9PEZI|nr:hypothetical protein M501DRAFT_1031460 [Patellaria atrata CBS 101060]